MQPIGHTGHDSQDQSNRTDRVKWQSCKLDLKLLWSVCMILALRNPFHG